MRQQTHRESIMSGGGLGRGIGRLQIRSQNICNPLFYEKIFMAVSVMLPVFSKFGNWPQWLQIAGVQNDKFLIRI